MRYIRFGLVMMLAMLAGTAGLSAATARTRYQSALAREQLARAGSPTLKELRATMAAYEALVRRHPGSGYSDNALWQAAGLALLAFERFGEERDRAAGLGYLNQLSREFTSSSLVRQVDARLAKFDAALLASAPAESVAGSGGTPVATTGVVDRPAFRPSAPAAAPAPRSAPPPVVTKAPAAASGKLVQLRDIRRMRLPGVVRVVIVLDAAVPYHEERLAGPDRVFFDLATTQTVATLTDTSLKFTDDVVKEIRTGRHPNNTTRVVLDLEQVSRYHVFTLEDPYRLVIDCERVDAAAAMPEAAPSAGAAVDRIASAVVPISAPAPPPPPPPPVAAPRAERRVPAVTPPPPPAPADLARAIPAEPTPPPVRETAIVGSKPIAGIATTASPSTAKYSISRQLGLGISRIVIDPGHGGHDPGAQHNRVKEAELVLDVALRLEKLLSRQAGVETVLTRRTDTYVTREERTAIANREAADLFISIHANSSQSSKATGVETYFLNFASGPDAEEVAARENAGTDLRMHNLPDIVRAIALNNKLDESRDFASAVQQAMVRRLSPHNRQLRNRGVKQAPFVVLIGAEMPSVLSEISFVTNKEEAQLLRTAKYRQRIAESLFDAIQQYRRSLKSVGTIAAQ